MTSILIADASVTNRLLLHWELEKLSIHGILANNGTVALELFAEILPDLVIANIDLPEVSGFEICRRIKAEKPEVPVILITCRTSPHTGCLARKVGASLFTNRVNLMADLDPILHRLLPQEMRQKELPHC